MSYIGNPPAERFTSFDYQDLTGGSGTSFTLTHPVGNAQEILVMVNNVVQEPGVAYTVSGTALTMTGSIASTDDFYVVYRGKAIQTATHPSDRALTATDGTFTGDLTVDTNTLHVDATNNHVGVGTVSPSLPLHINGASAGDGLVYSRSGTEYFRIDDTGTDMNIKTTGGGHQIIFTTNSSEVGRWRNGGGLTFNGDTAAANALDDYEEGTWTPSIDAGAISGTSISYVGRYIKIGKFVSLSVSASNTAGDIQVSSYVTFGGIPFTLSGVFTGTFITEDIDQKTRQGFCTAGGTSLSFSAGGSSSGTTSINGSVHGRLV